MRKHPPQFSSEAEEHAFWQQEDMAEHIDWSRAERVRFPKLKPSTKTISLRLPESLLDDVKQLAHKQDVPYQSLVKIMLADAVQRAQRRTPPPDPLPPSA